MAAHESGDNPRQEGGGLWQFQGPAFEFLTGLTRPAQDYSVAVQDHAALLLYRWDVAHGLGGFHAWSTRFVCGLG